MLLTASNAKQPSLHYALKVLEIFAGEMREACKVGLEATNPKGAAAAGKHPAAAAEPAPVDDANDAHDGTQTPPADRSAASSSPLAADH